MRALVLLNHLSSVVGAWTTCELLLGLQRRGHDVWVCPVDGVELLEQDEVRFRAVHLPEFEDVHEVREGLPGLSAAVVEGDRIDVVFIRTSPGKDERLEQHQAALYMLQRYREGGGLVLNEPAALRKAATKLYLSHFPSWTVPPTIVTNAVETARAFLQKIDGPGVIKPLGGTQGRDVYFLEGHTDRNLATLVQNLVSQGPVMLQAYLPTAPEGDIRILLVDGRPLMVDGQVAAIRRVPPPGEFRSNLHLGAQAEAVHLSDEVRAVLQAVGPMLREDRLFLVGLDIVGRHVVEVNVFAPGGLGAANKLYGVDFVEGVIAAMEEHLRRHQRSGQGREGTVTD